MQLIDTLETYRRLCNSATGGLPEMELGSLRLETREMPDPTSAWEALATWQPRQGWLQFQSRTVAFLDAKLPEPESSWGLLLDAEVIDCEARPAALSLRTLSPGTLRLVIAHPLDAGAGEQDYLTDEVRQLATKKTGHRFLCYRRYWRWDETAGFLPFFAAFQGFAN